MKISIRKVALIAVAIFLAVCCVWYFLPRPAKNMPDAKSAQNDDRQIAAANYMCDGQKTISAVFFKRESKVPAPGQPPMPGGSVKLTLSDGRAMTLMQTISADGGRYSDGEPSVQGAEKFVFWDKGNGALVLENNEEKSYTGCVQIAPDPGGLRQIYESGANGFSIRYPSGYKDNQNYQYQAQGLDKNISGVSFTVPEALAGGTNLASDSYISVEEMPETTECKANLFFPAKERIEVNSITENGVTYLIASFLGAAAGNRYEEKVYAVSDTNPCLAVRYFIHYGALENYPKGAVQSFDEQKIIQEFDAIRRSLIIR